MRIPVEKNKEYVINIDTITNEGNGVGRIEGFTVFVPQTAPGDEVRVLIVKVNTRFAYGKVLEILKPSASRIEPKCPVADKCGGCTLMHIDYKEQLKIKENIINDAMKRIGGFDEYEYEETIGMENPYEYRNKLIFPVDVDKQGKCICGFYASRSHRVVEVKRCFLGNRVHERIIKAVLDYIDKYKVSVYNEKEHKGLFRRIFIRQGFKSGETMVVLSVNGNKLPKIEELADSIVNAEKSVKSIILNVNTKQTNLVLGDKNIIVYGQERINDTLCEAQYSISAHSFFQVNPVQTEKLYKKAVELAEIKKDDVVMDIYCGIGTISLLCAKYAKEVIGVEIVQQAIQDAKENALINNIKNARFFAESAENIVPELVNEGARPNVVILDPPRKGSDEKTLSAIVKAGPDRVVYVSCNPATLARDARFLCDRGYKLIKVVGVDQFPHTTHVECCVLMCRVR